MTRTTLILLASCLAAWGAPRRAESGEAQPSPTPYPPPDPAQVGAPSEGVPPGYDDAIALPPGLTPVPSPAPGPYDAAARQDHDEFLAGPGDHGDGWDPSRPLPGNYHALPLTLDVGWSPCLGCSGDVYRRPGDVSLWVGYAFQPYARVSSPFMAAGVEWTLAGVDRRGRWKGRSRLAPTWRWGWNFSAVSVYATTGAVLPSEGRRRLGYHVGAGASSFAFLALAACTAEAIPSVVEVGADFLPEAATGRSERSFVLKIGWGF